jgi:3-deoxy-D-manno-octulosonic-acid transferase
VSDVIVQKIPPKLRVILTLYRLIWWICTPVILLYLYQRGRREPAYIKHLPERFGFHSKREQSHIWIHAVSLGEVRSAAPLIAQLLQGDVPLVTTHFTPAGRSEIERLFPDAVAARRLVPCYVPFDTDAAFRRFFKAFSPAYGLVMEVEFWPGMIMSCRKRGVPLFLCNGQYPSKSFTRDQARFFSRANIVFGFAGVMVKSQLQAERFAQLGVEKIAITGEMRFEQPISQAHITRAQALRQTVFGSRPIITLASVVEGEDRGFLDVIAEVKTFCHTQNTPPPLFIYVPRAPDRFEAVAEMIHAAGFAFARRSAILDAALSLPPHATHSPLDIILGDSLGEMYFYLELCDLTIVGGGFCPKGSHNISEPICLKKPVIIGPNDSTIEFPAREAIAAGLCEKLDFAGLAARLTHSPAPLPTNKIREDFLAAHSGSTVKTLAAITDFLKP